MSCGWKETVQSTAMMTIEEILGELEIKPSEYWKELSRQKQQQKQEPGGGVVWGVADCEPARRS